MAKYKGAIDSAVLGMAFAGVIILIFTGFALGTIYGASGQWLNAAFFGGLPLAGVFLVGWYCRKIKFFR